MSHQRSTGDMMRACTLALFLVSICGRALADHDSGAALSWHVLSAGLDESRVAIYRQQALVGIFNFSCDLTDADEGNLRETNAQLNLVWPASHPDGLLIVTCNLGAHSQYLAIVDPTVRTSQPVFDRTGSYFVKWELEGGELWISHDRSCNGGPSVECPDGFETVFEKFPVQRDQESN